MDMNFLLPLLLVLAVLVLYRRHKHMHPAFPWGAIAEVARTAIGVAIGVVKASRKRLKNILVAIGRAIFVSVAWCARKARLYWPTLRAQASRVPSIVWIIAIALFFLGSFWYFSTEWFYKILWASPLAVLGYYLTSLAFRSKGLRIALSAVVLILSIIGFFLWSIWEFALSPLKAWFLDTIVESPFWENHFSWYRFGVAIASIVAIKRYLRA